MILISASSKRDSIVIPPNCVTDRLPPSRWSRMDVQDSKVQDRIGGLVTPHVVAVADPEHPTSFEIEHPKMKKNEKMSEEKKFLWFLG